MKKMVSIVMGSDSDLPIMQEAAQVMEEFRVPYEISVVSAHRAPDSTYKYAKKSLTRGIRVIIAGAGGAAHLPGIIAALTTLPVIGVPIYTKTLGGVDSLYSIVQMPPGIPVATVGINSAKNAGLLAVKILAITDIRLQKQFEKYMRDLESTVVKKSDKLEKIGLEKYLESMKKI